MAATAYVARKPMKLLGEDLAAGDPVAIGGLPARLRRELIQQRRILPAENDGASDGVLKKALGRRRGG